MSLPQTTFPRSLFSGAARAALLAAASAAALPAQDAVVVHYRYEGDPGGIRYGYALHGGQDVDGDGYPDFLIGADGHHPNGADFAGSVYLYSGHTGQLLRRFDGFVEYGRAGHSVVFAGDVNADGVPDVLSGAPFASPSGMPYAGQVLVWSGKDGALLYTFFGRNKEDQLAHGIAAAGDVDRDGYDDFAVGSPWALRNQVGEVQVFSGRTGNELWSYSGDLQWSGTGYTLAPAGDVDGDGTGDLLAGAHAANPFGTTAVHGEVHLLSGASGGLIRRFTSVSPTEPHDVYGFAVAGAGDLNGDGLSDFVVGAPYGDTPSMADTGITRVVSGYSGESIYEWHGSRAGERFGRAVAGPGDMNGDGYPEIAVGSGYLPPFPFFGERYQGGSCYIYSGNSGALLFRFDGQTPLDSPGQFLGITGDVDGDGRNDLLSGSPYPHPSLGTLDGPGMALVLGIR